MKKSKRIELSEECIMQWSIEAIHNKSNFKKYVEDFLERTKWGKYEFYENPKIELSPNGRGKKSKK